MTVDYRIGDVRDVMATIPDGSVDLIASSPPFLALRSYLPAGHDDKHAEIGSEANPAAFLDTLLELTAEWGRVLAPHGSLAIELGDTYSGSGGENHLYEGSNPANGFNGSVSQTSLPGHKRTPGGWPLAKSLALIPQLYAVALAYGLNPLTGQASPAGRWRVRNVIVWHRPNPAVGALGDKVRPSTSYIVVATRSAKRWFDLTAVRTINPAGQGVGKPAGVRVGPSVTYPGNGGNHRMPIATSDPAGAPPLDAWFDQPDSDLRPPRRIAMRDHRPLTVRVEPAMLTSYIVVATRSAKRWFDLTAVRTEAKPHSLKYDTGSHATNWMSIPRPDRGPDNRTTRGLQNPAGAPPLDAWFDELDSGHDTWTLTTQPSSLAHYAMWPAKLAERLILMMCPLAVCRVCGEPRRRMEGATYIPHGDVAKQHAEARVLAMAHDKGIHGTAQSMVNGRATKVPHTLGWTDCGHDSYRPGLVLEPFAGTGTTLAVADLHGRDAIGIDIDARNRDIYPRRYDEVKRALYGTPAPMPGQLEMFSEIAI